MCSLPVVTIKQAQGCTGEGLKPEGLSPRLPASVHVLPCEPAGTDKQAQGCAGEGLKPEGISPRLRARMLAVTCSLVSLLGQTSKHRAAQGGVKARRALPPA